MNKVEFLAMNNPIRAFIQEHLELKRILHYVSDVQNKTVLEIGCGNGTGTKLIKKYFNPKDLYAIDLDKKMIDIASREDRSHTVHFQVGDAAKLSFKNNMFEAVFDFGIIHHIPNWTDCLKELYRVLKKNGYIIIEDLSIDTFTHGMGKWWRKILDHPYGEMYKREEFFGELVKVGFKIETKKIYNTLSIQYFIVIAQK